MGDDRDRRGSDNSGCFKIILKLLLLMFIIDLLDIFDD